MGRIESYVRFSPRAWRELTDGMPWQRQLVLQELSIRSRGVELLFHDALGWQDELRALAEAGHVTLGECWEVVELPCLVAIVGGVVNRRVGARLPISSGQWASRRAAVFDRDGYACRYCGAGDVELECDHVVPIARGGGSDIANLATACKPCNRKKRDMTLEELGWTLREIGQ